MAQDTEFNTLNRLIQVFESVAGRHKQINSFEAVVDGEIEANEDMMYPALLVNPTGAVVPKTANGFSSFAVDFKVVLVDLVQKDSSNGFEVLSDGLEVLKDIVNEFNTHPYYIESEFNIDNTLNFIPLHNKYTSEVSGWEVSITLLSPNRNTFCGAPLDNLVGFSFTPASVTVVDGLNTYELYPSQTYTCGGEPFAVNVSNSNDTYNVDTELDLELPNINFTDSDGITTSVPSMEDITAVACSPRSGIEYQRPRSTLQSVSYEIYDDGWQLANGGYNYNYPTNPLYCQRLDTATDPTGRTLLHDNAFGNKIRYTDTSGVLTPELVNEFCIDNLTGLMHYFTTPLAPTYFTAFGVGGILENYNTTSHGGYSDWYFADFNTILGIITYGSANHFNYPHLGTLSATVASSTTDHQGGATNYGFNFTTGMQNSNKTYNRYYLLTRKHF